MQPSESDAGKDGEKDIEDHEGRGRLRRHGLQGLHNAENIPRDKAKHPQNELFHIFLSIRQIGRPFPKPFLEQARGLEYPAVLPHFGSQADHGPDFKNVNQINISLSFVA